MRIGHTKIEDKRFSIQTNIKKTRTEKDICVVFDDKFMFSDHL